MLAGVILVQAALFFPADDIGVVQSAIAWTTGWLIGTDWVLVR